MKKVIKILVLMVIWVNFLYADASRNFSVLIDDGNTSLFDSKITSVKRQIVANKVKVDEYSKQIELREQLNKFIIKHRLNSSSDFNFNIDSAIFKSIKNKEAKNEFIKLGYHIKVKELGLESDFRGLDTYSEYSIKHLKDGLTYWGKKLDESEKELTSILNNKIKPFNLSKWHISPYEALEELCQMKSIETIGFSTEYIMLIGGNEKKFKKEEVCSNLSVNFIANNTWQSRLAWDSKKIIISDNNGTKMLNANSTDFVITAYPIILDNTNFKAKYQFNSDKELTGYLWLEDKERFQKFYFMDNNEKIYNPYALEKIVLFPEAGQINTVEEQEMKFDHLEGILTKKYNGYSIEIEKTPYDRKLQIRGYGDLVNLKMKKEGKDFWLEYTAYMKYAQRELFGKMLSEIEKSKKKSADDSSGNL